MISAAGGIPPRWGKTGSALPVNLEAWRHFNPEFIYGCSRHEKAVQSLLNREGWRDVEAVKSGCVTMSKIRDWFCAKGFGCGSFRTGLRSNNNNLL
jgi:ABC-type Fe3+-hydroxamate transport system substrate-binding protein